MLLKTGVSLQIVRKGSLSTVLDEKSKVIEVEAASPKNSEFIYFAAKSIAGDEPNGNGDYFPWSELLKSYSSFVGRNLFLNHNSQDPRNAIGKVLDAYPVVDEKSGEKYIECLAKIDAVANPELSRQLSTGILDAVSMGCSVETSTCSICGHIIHTEQDQKCFHMSKGLLKEYLAEKDLENFNIKRGDRLQAYAINQGLNFTELSVVNVPAWNNAKIVQVISQLREKFEKFVEQKQEVPSDLVSQLEDLIKMIPKKANLQATEPEKTQETAKVEVKAEAAPETLKAEIAPVANKDTEIKELLSKKLSALEYINLLDFVETQKSKKESAVAEPKIEAKAEAVAEGPKPAPKIEAAAEAPKAEAAKTSNFKAIFVSKPSIKESYWVVTENGKPVLKATLDNIWGDLLAEKASYATSWEYGDTLLSRLQEEGVEKIAALTNATMYKEAAKMTSYPEGKDLSGEGYASAKGPSAKGDEYPTAKSMGKDQYKPAAPSASAKVKKLPEGKDMSGGAHPSSTGPAAGGSEYPTEKSVGKDQYKMRGRKSSQEEGVVVTSAVEAPLNTEADKTSSEAPKTVEAASAEKVAAAEATPAEMSAEAPKAEATPSLAPATTPTVEAKAETKVEKTADAVVVPAVEAAPALAPIAEMPLTEAKAPAAEAPMPMAEAPMGADKPKSDKEMWECAESEVAQLEEKHKDDKKKHKALKAVHDAMEKAEKAMGWEESEAEEAAEEAEAKEEAHKDEAPKAEAAAAESKMDEAKKEDAKMDEAAKKDEKPQAMASQAPSERERELEAQLATLKAEQSLKEKVSRCQSIVSDMINKNLIAPDEKDVQAALTNGLNLFDARADAFKKAVDKQCTDLLKMDRETLQSFAQTINRLQKTASFGPSPKTLKQPLNQRFSEHTFEDNWLNDIFKNMGSQKGK